MKFGRTRLMPPLDRGPLRVMFLITSMPVGGAETLLVNLMRRIDRERFAPSLCCLKSLGPLGDELAREIPARSDLIRSKYDVGVVVRLAKLMRGQRIDAVVTVGAGDKMFWGRLAARWAGVPVVLCALHSTGWPDSIGRLNRSKLLTRWTDGFIGVAQAHARHLVEVERFPRDKVFVVPNGVDVARFAPAPDAARVRRELGLPAAAPVAGIVAALRPEKNHELFLRAAAQVRSRIANARFVIIGDGPLRAGLERLAADLNLSSAVHFLGSQSDIPRLLSALDVFVLTSRIEANPVSILEAMAVGKPVVAPRVGSVGESVIDGETGFLTEQGNLGEVVDRLAKLLAEPKLARQLGGQGRAVAVQRWSLERMVEGYEQLITQIYTDKAQPAASRAVAAGARVESPPSGARSGVES